MAELSTQQQRLREDPAVAKLLAVIIEDLAPIQVWLFGSRAEGRARPDSDYDLLVVLPDDAPAESLDMVRAWWIGSRTGVPADIIPCTKREFDEEKNVLDTLPRAAWLRGECIYER